MLGAKALASRLGNPERSGHLSPVSCATPSGRPFIPCFYGMVIPQQGPGDTRTNSRWAGIQAGTATATAGMRDTLQFVFDASYEVLSISLDPWGS